MASRPSKPSRFTTVDGPDARGYPSRRDFLGATAAAAGLVAASCSPQQPAAPAQPASPEGSARTAPPADLVGDGRKRRILLRGGVVLSLDPMVGDFGFPRSNPSTLLREQGDGELEPYFNFAPGFIDWQAHIESVSDYWSHVLLYADMIGMPLIGWAMLSAGGYPVAVSKSIILPAIMPHDLRLYAVLRLAHTVIAIAFFALILAHLAAALMHGMIRRDVPSDHRINTRSRWPHHQNPRIIRTHHIIDPVIDIRTLCHELHRLSITDGRRIRRHRHLLL